MKIKKRALLLILIVIIVGVTASITKATTSDLSVLKGTGSSNIGKTFTLSFNNNLKGNKSSYCIQKDKDFSGGEKTYTLNNYVEINGNQATVYSSSNSQGTVINSTLNGQIAYILNQGGGYGTHDDPTDTQQALWYIVNNWTSSLFNPNSYAWDKNSTAIANGINEAAINYANSIGNQKATDSVTTSSEETLSVIDKTDKDNISIISVDGYNRVGPFRWEFNGTLQSITVICNNGTLSSSNVRYVKYTGTTPNIVSASEISTGEVFYIDISQSSGATQLTGLTLKISSSTSSSSSRIYTAKIWFLTSSSTQNIIYVDVGDSSGNPLDRTGNASYDIPLTISLGLKKVDDRDGNTPLNNVGFKFKAYVYRYIIVGFHEEWVDNDGDGINETTTIVNDWDWRWVQRYLGSDNKWSAESEGSAKIFYTGSDGVIKVTDVSGETVQGGSLKAVEVSNPYYGYDVGTEYSIESVNEIKELANHQKRVKLSGYVWIDEYAEKTTIRNNVYDSGESGFNGITVYLKDTSGNIIKSTTTSELGLYSEINGGEYQFTDVDLDALQSGQYYVEFEYCGIDYQSVISNLTTNTGSKAIDTTTRNILDNKFSSVNGTQSQSLNVNGVVVNYNDTTNYVSTVYNHIGCNVYARTNEAGYNLYSGFTPTSEEIRYVNLGLYKKVQTDYALSQDLYNVTVDVNGFSHIYRYATVRYSNSGSDIDEDSSWNVGVKFQNNKGTYARAIYQADAEYESSNKDNELKVYVTYKIALRNESTYLGRINSIVDYCDSRYTMIAAGTSIDDNDNVTGSLNFSSKVAYNNEYSKYIIETNSTINSGETTYLYLQFEMNREAVLEIVNNGELLNNVIEINSYTTFKDNNVNTPVAVIDKDSVPGNAIPGNVNTYEDDTDAARSLQLEFKNERAITGTVFVDLTGKDSDVVYANQERLGNGEFDYGETTLEGIKVTLHELNNSIDDMVTYTDENGNFELVGYIPGNYTITYTWGDETYNVQYYKGTIYDEDRKQNNTYWYRGSEYSDDTISVSTRKTDALDNWEIREKIDNEMESVTTNILESEINKAYSDGSNYITYTSMDSTTPTMSFSVEYETTITDGTVDQVKFTVSNVDFGIVERAKQQLEFSKRISGFKITLANGQILVDAQITEDGKLKGSYDYTTYLAPTSINGITTSGIIRTEMDTELIEGATLEITYTMKATNIGELDYSSQEYYYYGNKGNGSSIIKSSVTGLLDYVDARLSVVDDQWDEVYESILEEVNASLKDDEDYLNNVRTYLTTSLSQELAPGESNTVELKTSKLLTSTDDNTFDNKSEIVNVEKSDGVSTGTPVKVIWNDDKFNFNIDDSETAIIIPSTGEDKSYVLPIIIGMSSLLILGVGIFVIKKFVIRSK